MRAPLSYLILFLGTLVLVAACATTKNTKVDTPTVVATPTPEQSQPAEPEAEAEPPSLTEQMMVHYGRVVLIRDAVTEADLPKAREHAAAFDAQPVAEELTGEPLALLGQMRMKAKEVAAAPTVESAADGVARMAEACGNCHTTMAAVPNIPDPPAAMSEGDTAGHMGLHLWAADRMWEALIMPDEQRWIRAADAMAQDPLVVTGPDEQAESVAMLQGLAKQTHELAKKARDSTAEDRAMYYSKFLASCGNCHNAMK